MSNSPRRSDKLAGSPSDGHHPTLNDSEESSCDDVRQRAYDLLNRMGGPDSEEDVKEWPQRPAATPKRPAQQYSSSYQRGAAVGGSGSGSGSDHEPLSGSHGRTTSNLLGSSSSISLTESFVNCVSGACKMASSEAFSQQASILRTGYHNLRTVVMPESEDTRWYASRQSKTYTPISGTFQTVNVAETYRGRYSDTPQGNER